MENINRTPEDTIWSVDEVPLESENSAAPPHGISIMEDKINASISRLNKAFERSRVIASVPIPIGGSGSASAVRNSFNSCMTHVDTQATVTASPPPIREIDYAKLRIKPDMFSL